MAPAAAPMPSVRPSAIAGAWYPGSASALRRTVEGYLDSVTPQPLPGPVVALVSPHAGYAYSGPTAAHAFAQVRGADFTRVILCGPLHRPVRGSQIGALMVPAEEAYRTPLGEVPVDRAFIAALAAQVNLTQVRGDEEHSLEIELPFLQTSLAAFQIVPLMFGEHIAAPGAVLWLEEVAAALAGLWDARTLIVVSTDLSHLDHYAAVVRTDQALVRRMAAFDVAGLTADLAAGDAQACGAAGLVAGLRAAQQIGARGARVLSYAASGDITGDKRPGVYTVGYLAAAIYR